MNHQYNPTMSWASTSTGEDQDVYSLLSNPGHRTPAVNASTLAAYSRSAKSIPDLLAYRQERGIDGAEVTDKIVSSYNHPSVMGLGHLYVAMENIDCITAMQYFNRHHLQDGQERSTRFQNFTKGGRKYAPCPLPAHRDGYHAILDYWLDGLEHFYPLVREYLQQRFDVDDKEPALNPRTLDCVRYLVPMGVSTNVGAVQSGREWSKWISDLRTMGQLELADAMETVLRHGWDGYVPEGDVLIRYTEPKENPIQELVDSIRIPHGSGTCWDTDNPLDITDTFDVVRPGDATWWQAVDPLLVHLYLLRYPHLRHLNVRSKHFIENLDTHVPSEEVVAQAMATYNWKHEPGPIASNGALGIHGMMDLGSAKDLNRHRSVDAFIPLLHSEHHMGQELLNNTFSIHPYLVGTPLGQRMSEYMEEGYRRIRWWSQVAYYPNGATTAFNRALKNLLPHGHCTPYVFYGKPASFMTYICDLRVRPGGHMAYRQLAHAWAECIAKQWPLWRYKVPAAPTFSRGEFIDRT